MPCKARHTPYNPSLSEWLCPDCGANNEAFIIEESASGSDDECTLLHVDDCLECFDCKFYGSGKSFAAGIMKRKSLVPCPECGGKGVVTSKPAES
jgi:hypothetical protein